MGIRLSSSLGMSTLLLVLASACAQAQISSTPNLPSNEWSRTMTPASGSSQSIGFYSNGCLQGAVALPLEGPGYQVMRPFRNRFYGHPNLIRFLENLGVQSSTQNFGILIGDLGQVRGGPLPYGHTSHQIGLDVDIWYYTHPEQMVRNLSEAERNDSPMPSVLNASGVVDPKKLTPETILKLKFSSLDPQVERIFVNPAIKTYLCTVLPPSELPWLHKLRPWPGHEDHFHVRIACPVGASNCTPQDPPPEGSGCSELMPDRLSIDLMDWHHESQMAPQIEKLLAPSVPPALPAECAKILRQN